jgi:Na+/H+ antiporter NhaD/arsenite permease-like protein
VKPKRPCGRGRRKLFVQYVFFAVAAAWAARQCGARANPPGTSVLAAALIFAATYLVIAVGRLPGSRLDRTGAALLGASLMVASGTLSLDEAYRAVDLETLALLLGMMILVANLRLAGFFHLANAWVARHARHPLALLAGVIIVSGGLSAFLVNDTVCLMLTPLVAEATLAMRRNPVPYLLALAMASNIGSTATITGNPQNIMIGSFSHIPYGEFAAALSPVAAVGLLLVLLLVALVWRREFLTHARLASVVPRPRWNRGLLFESLAVALGMVACFFWGVAPAKVAVVGGALLLLTPRVKPERVYREIDWPLLLLFAGLFIVVAGIEKAALGPAALAYAAQLKLDQPPVLALVAGVLSNLVSNVPAVLVLKPFVQNLADPRPGWLVLAMASTLAGNLTILGSVANLIVVQRARRHGIVIGFWSYFQIGAPLTLLTIALGVWLLR